MLATTGLLFGLYSLPQFTRLGAVTKSANDHVFRDSPTVGRKFRAMAFRTALFDMVDGALLTGATTIPNKFERAHPFKRRSDPAVIREQKHPALHSADAAIGVCTALADLHAVVFPGFNCVTQILNHANAASLDSITITLTVSPPGVAFSSVTEATESYWTSLGLKVEPVIEPPPLIFVAVIE